MFVRPWGPKGLIPVSKFSESMPEEMLAHYGEQIQESERLASGISGRLDFARSKEIIKRHLPSSELVVLDVGGGPGAYACWLAAEGCEVHLFDPVPKHIEQAREASENQPDHPIASVNLGDARSLPQQDESCDVVLLMGPLYHLTFRGDRMTALGEARRVLRPGGLIFVSAVNRFATMIDGLVNGLIDDPYFVDILEEQLPEGQHRNPNNVPEYFTTAYLHRPEELEAEIREAGLIINEIVAIQGPGWLANDFDARWSDPRRRNQLFDLVGKVERESTLMGVSPHFMAVASK